MKDEDSFRGVLPSRADLVSSRIECMAVPWYLLRSTINPACLPHSFSINFQKILKSKSSHGNLAKITNNKLSNDLSIIYNFYL